VTASKASDPPPAGPFGFEVRRAWRRDDPEIEADAIALWTRHGLLPRDVSPEQRAKELIAAAYKDGELAAVSTATIDDFAFLRARMAVIRGATDPEYRRGHAQLALAVPSREALRDWALANPEEKLAGGLVFVDRGEWGDFARLPVWPESELALVGYDLKGRQIRAAWFEHFRYDGASADAAFSPAPNVAADVDFRPAWKRSDAKIEADAIAFWDRLDILPEGVSAAQRAKELVLVAYRGDQIVGVVTAELGILPQVRERLAMLRGAVDPEFRRTHVGFAMLLGARKTLESWSSEHPDERLAGLGAIVESPDLLARQAQPFWPLSKFGVVGFLADGRQVRVSWFENFRLGQGTPPGPAEPA
jgi:hypothetical protein